jgi:hypothetical protein
VKVYYLWYLKQCALLLVTAMMHVLGGCSCATTPAHAAAVWLGTCSCCCPAGLRFPALLHLVMLLLHDAVCCCCCAGLRYPSEDGRHVLPAIESPEEAAANLINVANKQFDGSGFRCALGFLQSLGIEI